MAEMKEKRAKDLEQKALLEQLKGKENITKNGRKINVYANIGNVSDVGTVLKNDAGGIGLFRSEFLYLENTDFPTEEQQFSVYKQVAENMAERRSLSVLWILARTSRWIISDWTKRKTRRSDTGQSVSA